jgi:hypothetical protein
MERRDLSLILVCACAPQGSVFGLTRGELPVKKPCGPPGAMPVCQDAQYKEKAVLTINVKPVQVGVAPKTICIFSLGEIMVNAIFTDPSKRNTVRTVPKDFADIWIFGDNRSDARKFTLTVDDSVEEDDYKYGMATVGAGCIEPRISVKKK